MSEQLAKAKIFEVDKEGNETGGLSVSCMFNPFEYTVSKTNSFSEQSQNRSKSASLEFSKVGPQTLKLQLTFDTYEKMEDVSEITNKLWRFMEPKTEEAPKKKARPAFVAFEWGVFRFVAVITNMTQKFTMFTREGVPVRAKVDVTFTQFKDENDYPKQNPTSGDGLLKEVWRVAVGERLDEIASKVYGDATKWRVIADYNQIRNPVKIEPGEELLIPLL